jgi:hypothetical protein
MAISLGLLLRLLFAERSRGGFSYTLSLKCKRQNSSDKVSARCNDERYTDRDSDFPGKFGSVHRSSRMPLEKGWRTSPAAEAR